VNSHPRPGVVLLVAAFWLAGCGSGDPAEPGEIAARSTPAGVAPELVYVTEIEGFDLAVQSVGVSGDDGLSAIDVNPGPGGSVTLRTRRGAQPADDAGAVPPCADLSGDAPASGPRCAVAFGDVSVVLPGEDGVEAGTLRRAADAVHVPSKGELEQLFSEVPEGPGEPVERGDLPSNGDGAPIDEPGPGG
jgi:hypothetical protein